MKRALQLVRVSAFVLASLALALPAYGQFSGQRGFRQGGAQGAGGMCQKGSGMQMQNPFGQTTNFQNPFNQTTNFQNPFNQTANFQNPFNQTANFQNPLNQTGGGFGGGFQNGYGMMYGMQDPTQMQNMMQQMMLMQQYMQANGMGGQQNITNPMMWGYQNAANQGTTGATNGLRSTSLRRR